MVDKVGYCWAHMLFCLLGIACSTSSSVRE